MEQHTLALINTLRSSRMLQPYPKQEMYHVVCCHWHTATLTPSAGPIYQTMTHLDSAKLCQWHTGTLAPSTGPVCQSMIPSHWLRIILCIGTLGHLLLMQNCVSGDNVYLSH